MSDIVKVSHEGEVAIVTVDNPPVNAVSVQMRKDLSEAFSKIGADENVRAVVLACAGRTFIAGADIRELNRFNELPKLPDVVELIEELGKPVIAAIHGTALGGGLEIALGCHFRVAENNAKFGLPEVKLGILPGAGGTVRLARAIGASKALKLIITGTPIGAKEALAEGLVDALYEGDVLESAIAFAKQKVAENAELVATSKRQDKVADTIADLTSFEATAAELLKKAKGLEAPALAVKAVREGLLKPAREAIDTTREWMRQLIEGDQSKALRHLFFAEREAGKVEGVSKDVILRDIRKVAIIGAGTMGGGIAMAFANGGYNVTILDANDAALDRGFATIEKNYSISVSRGSLSEEEKSKRLARFSRTTDYNDLADADLVIEAVFEEMSVKKDVFGKLDSIVKQGAILASNTSYLDVNEIAESTSRPQDVVGLHFFSPANVMKLLEIVRSDKTSHDVLATALSVARKISKIAVVVGVCHGFVGNRMLAARSEESEALLLEGASPEQVDKVFTNFGFPMGPFQMYDLAGLDIGWRNRKSLGKTAIIGDHVCEQGFFGQKTGRGFYIYEQGSRTPKPDAELAQFIESKAQELGIERRNISDEEIIERTLYPLVNEGARIVEEGIAARASDVDIVWTNGYGFPLGKGGPMFWADLEGLEKIVERLDYWHGKTGKKVFEPASLLREKLQSNSKLTG